MRYLFSFLCLFLLSPFTFAQGKVYGGIYAAKIAVRGEAGPTGVNTPFGKADFILDTKNEMGYDKANQWVAWIGYEHDNHPWPKVQIHHNSFRESGTGHADIAVPASSSLANMPGMPSTIDTEVKSSLAVDATDFLFYYTPFDLPVKLDLGVGVRRLAVDFKVNASPDILGSLPPHAPSGLPPVNIVRHKKVTQHMPIFYASGYYSLPLKGTYATAATVYSQYKDRKLYHSRFAVGWISPYHLGIEAGYSHQLHRFNAEDSINVDIKLGGPFVALSLRF